MMGFSPWVEPFHPEKLLDLSHEFPEPQSKLPHMFVSSRPHRSIPPPRPPPQHETRPPIYSQPADDEISHQIHPPGHPMLVPKERAPRPVHVKTRPPEIIDRYHNPARESLQLPSAPVVAQPANCPPQQRRAHHMKKAEQSHVQRHAGIEHVLRSADQMPPRDQRTQQIHRV